MQPYQRGFAPPLHPAHTHGPQTANNEQQFLLDVIEYASKEEFSLLLDRALHRGANLNICQNYGCHALVQVVRANKPWAIAILMARGVQLPLNPPGDVDLLMESCRDSHVDMVRALLDVAHMSVVIQDHAGKTALHYAVIADSADIVRLLLEAGAETDKLAQNISHDEIAGISAHYAGLNNTAITPLMIAAAKGNAEICEALLDNGADPDHGACSALIIAALHHHESCFDLLLANGAKLSGCHDEIGRTDLSACMINLVPLEYLRKLVDQHTFHLDDGSSDSPLGIAIANGNKKIVALMMANDAPIEAHDLSKQTIWDDILPEGTIASEIANLVTAGCTRKIDPNSQAAFVQLLADITSRSAKPASLAASGIFTWLLIKSIVELRRIANQSNQLSSLQSGLMSSWVLKHSLTEVSAVEEPEDIELLAPDEYWNYKTAQDMRTQRTALFDGSEKLVRHCLHQLRHALTLEFFLGCAKDCPDNRSLASFMKKRLAEESGTPTPVIQLLVDAWTRAAKWTIDWQVAPDSLEEGNRFLFALTQNLILKLMDDFDDQGNVVIQKCIATIKEALPIASHTLSRFCKNPVSWLRQFENRSNLRPVNVDELANNLQSALGLPVTTCRNLSIAWKNAIDAAGRSSAWRTPADLQRFLERWMAVNITAVMTDESSSKIMPDIDILFLEIWKSRVLSPRPAATQGQKRTADDEPSDAPPRKEARI